MKPANTTAKFEFFCKRTKKMEQLSSCLEGTGLRVFFDSKNSAIAEHIESKDLLGNSHLFWRASFHPDRFLFEYSIPKESNPGKRRLQMLSAMLDLLALCDCYSLSTPQAYLLMKNSLSDSVRFVNAKYESLLNKYEKAEGERKRLFSQRASISSLLEKETSIRLELEKNISQLQARLSLLDGISDDELENELFEWMALHNGKISVSAFAKAHSVSARRVEEGLDKLLKGGYIERKA